jgi:hypothetical protein
MPLLNSGRDHITQTLIGQVVTPFDATNAFICVGDSSTAFSASQTDLQATTNKMRKALDNGFPSRTNNQITFQATFGTSEANFAWNEWGVANNATAGTLLNRKVESLGTKTNSQVWQFTATITVNNP